MLTQAKYIALTLATKKTTWLRRLLTKLGLFKASDQYAEPKVVYRNIGIEQILADIRGQKGEAISSMAPHSEPEKALTIKEALPSETTTNIQILLKSDYQKSIILAHNPVFHAQTKHIDI